MDFNVIKEEPVEFILIIPVSEVNNEEIQIQPNQKIDREGPKRLKLRSQAILMKTGQFECDVCRKCFKRKDTLMHHKKSHNKAEFHFQCDICDYKTHQRRYIRSHVSKHKSVADYKCPECFKFFKSMESSKKHLTLVHSERSFKCSKCDHTSKTASNIRTHERFVHATRVIKCQTCGAEFNSSTAFRYHTMKKHGSGKTKQLKTLECDICGLFMASKRNIRNHLNKHFDPLKYKCTLCEKVYFSSLGLHQHLSSHRNEIFSCPECSKIFRSIHNLKSHLKRHSAAKSHPCSHCQKKFKKKHDRIVHEERIHHKGEKLQCPKCPAQLKGQRALKIHMKRIHEG